MVLPCDFIPPPSLSLSTILNKFRQESTLGDAVCTTCWYEVVPPVEKHTSDGWSSAQQSVPIVWDEKTGTLLHVDIPDPAARISDDIQLKMSMLSMYVDLFYWSCGKLSYYKVSEDQNITRSARLECLRV